MNRAIRKVIDCRDFPNEIDCTLLISGSAKEVFNIALRHAIEEHGHQDSQELRKQLRAMMKIEIHKNKIYNSNKKKGNKK
jgi:hypothetical protein